MIKVLIQAEAGSCDKRLYDEKSLEYREMRHASRPYPYPYGFIIGTRAADGDSVDCYLITHDAVKAGAIVECDPIGLLLQDEGGEIDHKILAALPGQEIELGEELLLELQNFIYAVFSAFPEVRIRVGPILPREAALRHIQVCR